MCFETRLCQKHDVTKVLSLSPISHALQMPLIVTSSLLSLLPLISRSSSSQTRDLQKPGGLSPASLSLLPLTYPAKYSWPTSGTTRTTFTISFFCLKQNKKITMFFILKSTHYKILSTV